MAEEDSEPTIEALNAKLILYETQLANLSEDSANEGLRKTLGNLVNVTAELIRTKVGSKEKDDGKDTKATSRWTEYDNTHEMYQSADGGSALNVGSIIEVNGGERPYAGVITEIYDTPTASGMEVSVKYFEFESEVGLKWSNITALQPSDVNTLAKNEASSTSWIQRWRGEGKYSGDQEYYDCRIDELTKYGAKITFVGYGNQEEVPLAYLRSSKTKAEKADFQTNSSVIMPIPDKYQIKDTDSEQQRQYKLKKSKFIRNQNRDARKERESAAVQKNWQKFVAKGSRKNLAGMGLVTGRTSTSGSFGVETVTTKGSSAASRKRMRFTNPSKNEETFEGS